MKITDAMAIAACGAYWPAPAFEGDPNCGEGA